MRCDEDPVILTREEKAVVEIDPRLSVERAKAAARDLADALNLIHVSFTALSDVEPSAFISNRMITARAWQRADRLRFQADDTCLFSDPAWNILLDLYVQSAEGRAVSVTDACLASGTSQSTAFRWIERLQNSGWLAKAEDEHDGRRTILLLTGEALTKLNKLFDTVVESDRKLGLGRLHLAKEVDR